MIQYHEQCGNNASRGIGHLAKGNALRRAGSHSEWFNTVPSAWCQMPREASIAALPHCQIDKFHIQWNPHYNIEREGDGEGHRNINARVCFGYG